MSRLQSIDPANASGKAGELLTAVQSKMGMVPNMTRAMASAPVVLESYLASSGALANGTLDAPLREKLALLAAQENSCGYCLSAHTAVGKMVGVPANELVSSRRGQSGDAKHQAALRFAQTFLDTKGGVSEADLAAVREAGFNDGEVAEIAANTAVNIFTNYFNRLANPEVDFPRVDL